MTDPHVEARSPIAAGQARGQNSEQNAILTAFDAEHKPLATAKAYAAQAGCTLHELAGGGYLLSRWNVCKELPDLRAVNALLRRMGVGA